jgi:bifunctional non-homologous end joining protein LigD
MLYQLSIGSIARSGSLDTESARNANRVHLRRMAIDFGVAAMKAVLGSLPAPGDDHLWAFEVKWDGYRTLAHANGGRVRLQSSNAIDVTAKYPELSGLADAVHGTSAVLDGELVVLDDTGRPNFGLLQSHAAQVVFYAFDILSLNGLDTIGLPYEDRRSLLDGALESGQNWAVPAHRVGDGADLVEVTRERGLEGVMAKRLGSLYIPGKRSPNWRKIKHRRRETLWIGGWHEGTGSRQSTFGSLLLGVREPDGRLRFAGAVGTGFDQRLLDELTAVTRAHGQSECPFTPPPPREVVRQAHWMNPVLQATIEIGEWTNDGIVRHPSFIELVEP